LEEDSINYSHISLGTNSNKGRKFPGKAKPLVEIMIKNSTYSRNHLKERLLKEGILENKCIICGLEPIWQNKKLVMVLDHINGVPDDHRKENLRLLCPNCNSQIDTFAGKRNKKKYNCTICGNKTTRNRKYCNDCFSVIDFEYKHAPRLSCRKVKNRPPKEQLLQEIKKLGYCGTGRKYGVSDNAIRKWVL